MFPEVQIQGMSRSAWAAGAPEPELAPPLSGSTSTDVCIVGAGMAGLSTAYQLCRAGLDVVVLDRAGVGAGETARTTAHLTALLDYRYQELRRMHGKKAARVAAQSHASAIASIEAIAREEAIDCDFRRLDGYLFEPPNASDRALQREAHAAREAGVDCEVVAGCPLPFPTGPALRVRAQAEVHPLKYLTGLARAVHAQGGRIFKADVRGIDEGKSVTIRTATGERVVARTCVVATNTPMNDRVAMHTKQYPYRTYALGVLLPPNLVPNCLFWDTAEPYHYLRIASAESLGLEALGDVLIVGGEDHKVGQDPESPARWSRLEAWTRERVPSMGTVVFRWSGQVQEPSDGLGYIGVNPGSRGNVYIATGHSGNGITYGAFSGLLLSDLLLGRSNAAQAVFEPSRKPTTLKSILRFARENANVAKRYTERLRSGSADSVAEIPRGAGRVIRREGQLLAVYVDDAGAVHERSAVCPHLGCVVAWNAAERSWDCPCHGSRFEATGEVLIGPAARGLDGPPRGAEHPRPRPEPVPPERPGAWLEPGKP